MKPFKSILLKTVVITMLLLLLNLAFTCRQRYFPTMALFWILGVKICVRLDLILTYDCLFFSFPPPPKYILNWVLNSTTLKALDYLIINGNCRNHGVVGYSKSIIFIIYTLKYLGDDNNFSIEIYDTF